MDSFKILLSTFVVILLNEPITSQYIHPPHLIHHPGVYHHHHHHFHHHPHVEYIPVLRGANPDNDESLDDMPRSNDNENLMPQDQHLQQPLTNAEMSRRNMEQFQPHPQVQGARFNQGPVNQDNFQLVDGHMLQPEMNPHFQMRLANKESFPTFDQMNPSNTHFVPNFMPNTQSRSSDLNTGEVETMRDANQQPIFPPGNPQFLMRQNLPNHNQQLMNGQNHMSMRSNEDIFGDSMLPMEELSMFSNNRNMEIPNSEAFPFDQFRQSNFMLAPQEPMQQPQLPFQQPINGFSGMQPFTNLALQDQASAKRNPLRPETLSQEVFESNGNKMRKSSDMVSQGSKITIPTNGEALVNAGLDSSAVEIGLSSNTNQSSTTSSDVISSTNDTQNNDINSEANKTTTVGIIASPLPQNKKNSDEKSRMTKANETILDVNSKDLKNSPTNINSNILENENNTTSNPELKDKTTTSSSTTSIPSNKLRADQTELSSESEESTEKPNTATTEQFSTTSGTTFSGSENMDLTTQDFTSMTSDKKVTKPPKKFGKFNKKTQARVAGDLDDQPAHAESDNAEVNMDEEPNELHPITNTPFSEKAAELSELVPSESRKTEESTTTEMIPTSTAAVAASETMTTEANGKVRSSEIQPVISSEPAHPSVHLIPPHENFPPNNVPVQQVISPSLPPTHSVHFVPLEQHVIPIPSHLPHVQPVHVLPLTPEAHFIETGHIPHVQPVHIFEHHSEVVPIHIIDDNQIINDPNYNARRNEDDIERTAHIIKQKFIQTPFGTPFGSFGGPQFIGQPSFGQPIPFQSSVPISQPQLIHSNGFPGVSNFGVSSSSSSSSTSFNSGFREAEEKNATSEKMAPETESSFPPIVGHIINVPARQRQHNIQKREISEKISTNTLIPVVQKIGSAFKNDPKATEAFHQVEDFLESFPISGNIGLEDSDTGPEFSSGFTAKFPTFNGNIEEAEPIEAENRSKRTLALLHLLGHPLVPTVQSVRSAQPKVSPLVHANNALGSVQQAAISFMETPMLGLVFPTQETVITEPQLSQAQGDASPIVSGVNPSILQPKEADQCPHQMVSSPQHQVPVMSPQETFANLHNFLMSAREAFSNLRSQQDSFKTNRKSLKSTQRSLLGINNAPFEQPQPMLDESSQMMRSAENSPMFILRPVGRSRSRQNRRMFFVAEPFNQNMQAEVNNPNSRMISQESNIMMEPVNIPQQPMEAMNLQGETQEPMNVPRQIVEPPKRPSKRRKSNQLQSKLLPEGSIVGRIIQDSQQNRGSLHSEVNADPIKISAPITSTERTMVEPTPPNPFPNDVTVLNVEQNGGTRLTENEPVFLANSDENKIENDDLEISNSNLEPQIVKMNASANNTDQMNSPIVTSFMSDMKEKMGNLMQSFQKMAANNENSPKVQCVLPPGVVALQPNPNFNQEINSNSVAEPSADNSPQVGSSGLYELPLFKPFGGHASDVQIHNYLEQFHQNPDANMNTGSYYDPPGIRSN